MGQEPPELIALGEGAGDYSQAPPNGDLLALKAAFQSVLAMPFARYKWGDEAVAHLQHYFKNEGTDLWVNVEKLVEESTVAQKHFWKLLYSARSFATGLSDGEHEIVSRKASILYIGPGDSGNWNKAIGAYHAWAQAQVQKQRGSMVLKFTYHLWDPYDWDLNGEAITIQPIDMLPGFKVTLTNELMGEFHRQGMAQEYLSYGQFRVTFRYKVSP
jgi:hypothetical protein